MVDMETNMVVERGFIGTGIDENSLRRARTVLVPAGLQAAARRGVGGVVKAICK